MKHSMLSVTLITVNCSFAKDMQELLPGTNVAVYEAREVVF